MPILTLVMEHATTPMPSLIASTSAPNDSPAPAHLFLTALITTNSNSNEYTIFEIWILKHAARQNQCSAATARYSNLKRVFDIPG